MQDEKPGNTDGLAATTIVVGLALIVLAPLMDLIGADTGQGFGTGQMLLAVLGLLLTAVGGLLRMPRLRRWLRPGGRLLIDGYRLAAFAVFNLFLLFAAVELVGWLIDRYGPSPALETRGAYYASQPWARQHWREFEKVKQRIEYSPYTTWRTGPFQGETLRVDERGVRRTLDPTASSGNGASPDADVETIYTFGGSALWGHGAPDDGTLPALLQGELGRTLGRPVRVENLGERGHVATQSLIRLMLELQAGRVPDRVIFYHGFNDVAVALAGDVGGHYAETHIANRLERPFTTWLAGLRTLLFLRPLPTTRQPLSEAERIDLARAIVDNYLGSYRLLEGIAREYAIDVHCFWQPVRSLNVDPASAQPRSANAAELDSLLTATYVEIEHRAARLEHLHTLAGMLDDADPSLWADPVHLTPLGNRRIATVMANVLLGRLLLQDDQATSAN